MSSFKRCIKNFYSKNFSSRLCVNRRLLLKVIWLTDKWKKPLKHLMFHTDLRKQLSEHGLNRARFFHRKIQSKIWHSNKLVFYCVITLSRQRVSNVTMSLTFFNPFIYRKRCETRNVNIHKQNNIFSYIQYTIILCDIVTLIV